MLCSSDAPLVFLVLPVLDWVAPTDGDAGRAGAAAFWVAGGLCSLLETTGDKAGNGSGLSSSSVALRGNILVNQACC